MLVCHNPTAIICSAKTFMLNHVWMWDVFVYVFLQRAKAATLSGINIHVQWNVLSVKYTTISVCWCVRHTEAERPTKLNEFNWQHPITSFIHLYYCILWNTCSFGIMFCTTKSNCWQRCKQRAKQQCI